MNKEKLLELFDYRDGNLYWKKYRSGINVGKPAGCFEDEYCRIYIDGKHYRAHRLIFLMHHGYLPEQVDHIDGDKYNNKIENLRAATHAENQRNSPIAKNNTSGIKGVSWNKRQNQWVVRLMINKKSMYFGHYFDIDYAKFVAEAMRHKYHGKFARQ